MIRLSCSFSLCAALLAMPQSAQANPTVATALRTVAVANGPGVAEAVAPAGGSTTEVKVVVTQAAAEAPAPAPAPILDPPEPPRPTAQELYAQEVHAQIHHDRKTGRGLLAGGLAVAGTAYLFTSLSGALAIDRAADLTDDPLTEVDEGRGRQQRRAFGRALLIPGVGPALAITRADTAVRAWAAGVAGLTQALGAGLAVVGIHRLARARRLGRIQLTAGGTRRQAQVSLQVRF